MDRKERLGEDGRPLDKSYLEKGLPPYMQKDLDGLKDCIRRRAGFIGTCGPVNSILISMWGSWKVPLRKSRLIISGIRIFSTGRRKMIDFTQYTVNWER